MRRLIIFNRTWAWAVCALALVGVVGIALTVLAGSAVSSGRLVASSGGVTKVQKENGQASAATRPVAAERRLRNTPRPNRMTSQIAIGSDPSTFLPLIIKVDTYVIDGSQGNPQTFDWDEGETHYLSTIPTGQTWSCGAGCQDVFISWSDGGAYAHFITVNATLPTTILARFQRQYLLTMNVNPAGKGSVVPSSGWYNAGAPLTLTATANAGYAFGSWAGTGNGSYQGNINPHGITMNGPITETANFVQNAIANTITSDPTGTGYVIVESIGITTPKTYDWVPGSSKYLKAVTPISCGAGCQYVFQRWNDYTFSPERIITVLNIPDIYSAIYQKRFLLTMKVSSPVGSIQPGTSWHNSGVTVPLTASGKLSEPRYDFLSWTGTGSGSYTGTTNHVSVTMNGPITETANFKRNPGKAESPSGGPKPN